MKNVTTSLLFIFVCLKLSYGQNTFPSSGSVGIGTTSPLAPLDVSGTWGSFSSSAHVISSFVQDHTNNRGIYLGYDAAGQIGIIASNTATTASNLAFWNYNGSGGWFEAMRLGSNGNMGLGTTNLQAKFNVFQSTGLGSTPQNSSLLSTVSGSCGAGNVFQHNIWLVRNSSGSDWYTAHIHDGISIDVSFLTPQVNTQTWWERDPANNIQSWGNNANTYLMIKSGNVLIGKTSQANTGYILDINGNVRANQVVINSTGADFVFEPNYQLQSLSALEKYVKKSHHLPEIATAKEMQTNGLNVGENQTKLLQKVEELTLYLIDQHKKGIQQQETIKKLSRHAISQQKQINELIRLSKHALKPTK